MKGIFTLLVGLIFLTPFYSFCAVGTFEYYINTQKSGDAVKNYGDFIGGTSFDGSNLGTVSTTSQTLTTLALGLKSWEDNSSEVTSASFFYRVYKTLGTPGAYTEVTLSNPAGKSGNDREWVGVSVNFLTGITDIDDYTVEMYFRIESNQVNANQYEFRSNSGNNYKATFRVDASLPVELLHFSARPTGQGVELDWATASEIGNAGFEVQHSNDARSWKAIGWVDGHGDSQERHSYGFLHQASQVGPNYYRLKQVDHDGGHEYSKLVQVEWEARHLPKAYPTRATSEVWLSWDGQSESQRVTVRLQDAQGRLLRESVQLVGAGQEGLISLDGLSTGLYFLQLQGAAGNSLGQHRILKK